MDVGLVDEQMRLEAMRVADLTKRLAGLEPLTKGFLVGRADDPTVAVGDQGELADLIVQVLEDRLQLLGEFLVLFRLGPILAFGALAVPESLVEVEYLVRLALD